MYQDNIKKIEALIINYFDGIYYGDVAKLENCFFPNMKIFGDINGAGYLKTVHEYIEGVKNRQSPNDLNEDYQMKIIGIDIMGKIAMAKLHVPMLGYNYYDYISLTEIDGHWKIVNKLFTNVA